MRKQISLTKISLVFSALGENRQLATPKPARWIALEMAACRQAHLAAFEIDGKRRSTSAGGGTRDGLYAAVAIHAGDLEDEFLNHVI